MATDTQDTIISKGYIRDSIWRKDYHPDDQEQLRKYDDNPDDPLYGRAIDAFARNVFFPLFYKPSNEKPTGETDRTAGEATKAVERMKKNKK
jgi:hypothetical protein